MWDGSSCFLYVINLSLRSYSPVAQVYECRRSLWQVPDGISFFTCFFRTPQESANMSLLRAAIVSTLVLGAACRQFEIPEVASTVGKIINKLDSYVHYHGNHSDTAAIPASSDMASIIPRQSTPYWYEEIAHQGISAFGPSGYAVYRNVKDYGATGTRTYLCLEAVANSRRQRSHGRYGSYKRRHQCWRPLWPRLCLFNNHPSSGVFPSRNIPYILLHNRPILYPTHREPEQCARYQSYIRVFWIWPHRCGQILHFEFELGVYECIYAASEELRIRFDKYPGYKRGYWYSLAHGSSNEFAECCV